MECKTPKEKQIIRNEVGLMNICKENENILRCYECFDFKQRLWIFLEYMNAGCLTSLVEEKKGAIDERVCAYILYSVLKGLNALHSRGILHRDIKSDNILVNKNGDVKIADFGYAA